jgi:hypothetical protein
MKRMCLYMPKRSAEALQKIARLKRITQGDLVSDLLEEYFKGMTKPKDGKGP